MFGLTEDIALERYDNCHVKNGTDLLRIVPLNKSKILQLDYKEGNFSWSSGKMSNVTCCSAIEYTVSGPVDCLCGSI